MATQQRNVFPTDQIAHMWAHQTQPSARNPQGNFHYATAELYSYSTVIAKRYEHKRLGKDDAHGVAFLCLDRRFSSTTNGHQSSAHSAARGNGICCDVVTFPRQPSPNYDNADLRKHMRQEHRQNVDHFIHNATEETAKAKRARLHADWHIASAGRWLTMAAEYCAFFRLNWKIPQGEDMTALADAANVRKAEQRAKDSATRKAAREQAEQRAAHLRNYAPTAIQQWRNDGNANVAIPPGIASRLNIAGYTHIGNFLTAGHGDLMRLDDSGNVQTSQNVRVPIAVVRRTLRSLDLINYLDTAEKVGLGSMSPIQRTSLGGFSVDAVCHKGDYSGADPATAEMSPIGVRCGCHWFSAAEVRRIASAIEAILQTDTEATSAG